MNLPQVGQPLDAGIFAGVTTHKGKHYAVVLLSGRVTDLTWDAAVQWAAEQGGTLPTRAVAALLEANLKHLLSQCWHWTADESGDSNAWGYSFGIDGHGEIPKSVKDSAVAVKLLELT